MKIKTFLLIGLVCLPFFSSASEEEVFPSIYWPTFETTLGTHSAGTAFVVEHQQQNYIISSQHLIGEWGGLERNYSGTELISMFKKVTLESAYEDHLPLSSTELVPLPHAASFKDASLLEDLFIAKVDKVDSLPLQLATTPPQVGDRIMLYAVLRSSEDLVHFATVIDSSSQQLAYLFEDKSIVTAGASGAPLLNENLEVVGMHLASTLNEEGFRQAWANPVGTIIKELSHDQASQSLTTVSQPQ